MSKKVVEELKKVLANSYALYLKTQNYHWNVTGPQFNSLHALFQLQYEDLTLANDEVAERIRTLGDKAPGTFDEFKKLSKIKDGDNKLSATEMVKQLAADQDVLVKALSSLLKEAQAADDDVTIDLAIRRMAIHEKNAWMLKSSI